jgi:hypothetical protein
MPPEEPRKTRPLGQGAFDGWRGELPPLLPGGAGETKTKGMKVKAYATMLLGLLTLAMMQTQPVWALDGSGIGQQVAGAIRGVIVEIIAILTPVINILGVGMIIIGLLLGLGLRQEFLGFRLAIGGALALLTIHVIVPLLLGFV